MTWRASAAALIVLSFARLSFAQPVPADDFRGHVEMLGAFYPALDLGEGRVRLFASYESDIGDRWFVLASGHADGLVGTGDRAAAGVVRPLETFLERRGERLQVRFGLSNVVWGVLDEISPQDVINPVDITRFVLEGRAEARLPVPMARLRLLLPADLSVEALLVPFARRGTFDQLDEARSPFAHPRLRGLPRSDLKIAPANMEGGVRLHATRAGFDWGASVYRDVVDFDRYRVSATGLTPSRPSRWMVGSDVEAARGEWVVRGEGAVYVGDPLQAEAVPLVVSRSTFQGGIGADRRVGESTLFLDALYRFVPEDPLLGDSTHDNEFSVVAGLTRDFSGGTRSVRVFGLWNLSDRAVFARAIWSEELVERLNLEVGGAVFLGEGGAFFGDLTDADVLHARLRVRF
jgi:hypothetical protein